VTAVLRDLVAGTKCVDTGDIDFHCPLGLEEQMPSKIYIHFSLD
jgi:hypothetical protein